MSLTIILNAMWTSQAFGSDPITESDAATQAQVSQQKQALAAEEVQKKIKGKSLQQARQILKKDLPKAKIKIVPLSELSRVENSWSNNGRGKPLERLNNIKDKTVNTPSSSRGDPKLNPHNTLDSINQTNQDVKWPVMELPPTEDTIVILPPAEAGKGRSLSACQMQRVAYGIADETLTAVPNYYGVSSSSKSDGSTSVGNFYWPNGGSGGSDQHFLILLAVVGLVVVASLVVYAGVYLYKTTTSRVKCLAWYDVAVRWSGLSGGSKEQFRSGNMTGLYLSRTTFLPTGTVGLGLELGHFDMDLKFADYEQTAHYNGPYFLLGPNFEFPIFSSRAHFFQIELLAGTTTDTQIGVMSRLSFGYRFAISKLWSLSLQYGVGYVRVKSFDGLLNNYDDLSHIYGFNIGTRYF